MRIDRQKSAALLVDVQERLFPHMDQHEKLLQDIRILLEGLKMLQIPMLVTEQYPKGLGPTLQPLSVLLDKQDVIEKLSFSCCGEAVFSDTLKSLERSIIILCGIEAHVCVLQTAVDLIEEGYAVVVVEAAVSKLNNNTSSVAPSLTFGKNINQYGNNTMSGAVKF